MEQHGARTGFPTGDPAGYAPIEALEIGLHRPRFECDRQGLAVQPVLVEIEQRQAARKKALEHFVQAVLRGENLRLIEQDEFVRLWPQKRDAAEAERARAV